MLTESDPLTTMSAVFVLMVQGAVSVLVIVMAAISYRAFARHWRNGLAIGVVIWVLLLPASVVTAIYFDPSALVRGHEEEFMRMVARMGAVLGVVLGIGKIGWWLVVYVAAAAQWHRIHPAPLALIERRGRIPWGAIAGGLAFGVAVGVGSMALFGWLGVEESEAVKLQMKLFPGVSELPGLGRALVYVPAFVGIVIVEELAYRGVLLGALLRWTGRTSLLSAAAIIAVALLWAVLHIQNTDQPVVKISQIFLVGLVLGEMARRWGLETAIAGHVGLNVAAGVLAFV